MATIHIETEVLESVDQAEERKAQIYRHYHPAGYGTHLTIRPVADGYKVVGYRYDSCD